MSEHECMFPEEMEPSDRLILAPCLVCSTSALDALEKLQSDVNMWRETARGIVKDMRNLALDFDANGNSRPLGDPAAKAWHAAALLITKRLTGDE